MTSFRVPTSKYRHVFSSTSKRENSYEGFRFTRSSCDNPLCAANPKFLAFGVDCGGGGAFQVGFSSMIVNIEVIYLWECALKTTIFYMTFFAKFPFVLFANGRKKTYKGE